MDARRLKTDGSTNLRPGEAFPYVRLTWPDGTPCIDVYGKSHDDAVERAEYVVAALNEAASLP